MQSRSALWTVGAQGAFVSQDGVGWRSVGHGDFKINALVRTHTGLVAGAEMGLWLLPDGKDRWIQLHDETLMEVRALALTNADPWVVAATAYGLASSRRDECGYLRWKDLSTTLSRVNHWFSNAVLTDPKRPDSWLVGTEAGVMLALAKGTTWRETRLNSAPVRALLYAQGRFWAGADVGGVWCSEDGLDWQIAGSGAEDYRVFSLAWDGVKVLAGSLDGLLIGDGSGTWERIGPRLLVSAVAAHDGIWLAGGSPGGLWRSEDHGASWQQVGGFVSIGALLAPTAE